MSTYSSRSTYMAKEGEVEKKWWVIDATDKTLGRLATEVAQLLRGKKKPQFTRHVDTGDMVVVVNSAKVKLSGNKLKDKLYWRHSRFFGGIYNLTAEQLLAKDAGQVISKAVQGMLPTNKLSDRLLTHLKCYSGAEHPHKAQNPQAYKL
jgi:large subunit ribosomal protein L13